MSTSTDNSSSMSPCNSIQSPLPLPPTRLQPKNASALAPVVSVDATALGFGQDSVDSLSDTLPERASLRGSLSSLHLHNANTNTSTNSSDDEQQQSPGHPVAQTLAGATLATLDVQPPQRQAQSAPLGPPLQLRTSVVVDQEQLHDKLVHSKVNLVLVLTALVQLPDQRQTWVEQSRTELLSLDKGHPEGYFVKTLPLQIMENTLVIGFTLLVLPSPNSSSKVLSEFPALEGYLPWAEASVAVEHFVTGHASSGSIADRSTEFTIPLIEVALSAGGGEHKKRKPTAASLTVVVEESLPILIPSKISAEQSRIGPSFSQSYHGHSVRGSLLYARESLYESPLAFTLPIKLLQLLAQDEEKVLQELEKEQDVSLSDLVQSVPLDHRPNPITRGVSFMETLRRSTGRVDPPQDTSRLSTKARQSGLSNEDSQLQKVIRQQISAHRNIKVFYENMTQKVEQKLRENMEVGQGPFRRSQEKKDESVQWIPVNCCVQDLLVHDEGYQVNYKFTTVGAAAAHGAGFSRGSGSSKFGKAPPMGAYWDKHEKGQDIIRDLTALRGVLSTSAAEYFSLITAPPEDQNSARILAVVKETRFLLDEIVVSGNSFLEKYLTSMSSSAESTGQFVRGEIHELLERLGRLDLGGEAEIDQPVGQEPSANWKTHIKHSIKDILTCSEDLLGFIAVAIQLECLMVDSIEVAGPEWVVEKRTRECCFSQAMTALATAFLALLEDWWCEMSQAVEGRTTAKAAEVHLSNGMALISEESTAHRAPGHEPSAATTAHRASTQSIAKATRRPSLKSSHSSSSNTHKKHGRSDSFIRSKLESAHPLEDFPTAKAQNEVFWDQLSSLGWLVQIESLLSTQGSELGMLLDYLQAIVDVRASVSIGFHSRFTSADSETDSGMGDDSIQISGRRGKLTLSFGLDPVQFSLLPDALKAGTSCIRIIPVLFSQGINEMQTLSNLRGKSPLQRAINEKGLRQMQSYVSRYQEWQVQSRAAREQAHRRHEKSQTREYGPRATSASLGHLSNASLLSDLGAEWDVVSPTQVEMWHGESLVAELLDRLEKAILGRADDARQMNEDTVDDPIREEGDVRLDYPSPDNRESHNPNTRSESASEQNSGILGSVVEFGTSRLFSARATKDVNILQCAEALTRALGQVRPQLTLSEAAPSSSSEEESGRSTRKLPPSPLWTTSHVVSCKSAKDRTSMAVTLSEVNLLRVCHGLQISQEKNGGDDWQAILDAMRSEVGVRIKNVERNLKLGIFAKDLLWISAFGSSSKPVSEEQVFDGIHTVDQDAHRPAEVKDAVSFIKSLIPESTSSDGNGAMGHTHPWRTSSGSASTSGQSLVDDDESLVVVDRGLSFEGEAQSGVLQTISPTTSNSPPPSASAVPVVHTSTGQEGATSVDSGPAIHRSDTALSQDSTSSVGQEEHYTSFPHTFEETHFSNRLARTFGLDSRTRAPAGTEPAVLMRNDSSQSVAQICQPGSSTTHPPLTHRSTPSWSSQQSAYFQQQQQQQVTPGNSRSSKRASPLVFGLGFLTKATKDDSAKAKAPHPLQHNHRPSVGSLESCSDLPPLCSTSGVGTQEGGFKRGKFAFNNLQIKFLPAAYRPPRRMTAGVFES
ncbi:hypothetical protein EMPS_01157 [Entomortierella parvispora]|uniref:Uncharacterized protein n=1 Tax=Entomortierella parvispora TaxID=205924 RepID=A0A9P3H2A3_9FUNG|nr:hypothetical protein EMPS_01157 [Entomortierella parvispora]